MTFINPDKSTKEIIDEVFDITKKDPAYLKSVIRGYVIDVEKGLDELLKIMGKKGFSFGGKGLETPYLTLSGSYSRLSAWLLGVIFDSKKYSEAPPDFEPLPDAPIKIADLKEAYFNKIKGFNQDTIKNMYALYGLRPFVRRNLDNLKLLVDKLADGSFAQFGATGLEDIDVMMSEGLHIKLGAYEEGLARKGYFIKKRDEKRGGYFKIGSRSFGKKHGGKFDIGKTLYSMSQGLNKINPMMYALNDKKTSKMMAKSGEITNDNLLPAVVSMGKPVYDATAISASTMITGNPVAGKILADSLWKDMVADKGIDPRDRQKSELLKAISGKIGAKLGKESGKIV
jgi:hypothetical protein